MLRLVAFIALVLSVYGQDAALTNRTFPEGFRFGVASAAYQFEGGWNEDGKGESMWDWFTHTYPSKINNGSTGDVACDSYHKWREDIKLLKELGVNSYRISLSWTRLLPNGTVNNVNQDGIKYYTNIFETLRANNIEPLVTLYHWDLPMVFQEMGGWLNPVIADYFAEYARFCFKTFGTYVKFWVTINEPQVICKLGYVVGRYAPGYTHKGEGLYRCAYVNMLANAKAYHIYDDEFRAEQQGNISIIVDGPWNEPYSDSEEDQLASEIAMEFSIGLFANPIFNGNWPQIVIDRVGNRSLNEGFPKSRLPAFTSDEIEYIKGTSDYYCVNTYGTQYAKYANGVNDSIGDPDYTLDIGVTTSYNSSWPHVVDFVQLVPWGFKNVIKYGWEKYGKEVIITENGWIDIESGIRDDTNRTTFLSQNLNALLEAYYDDGINVTGFVIWSFMDNFAWNNGYKYKAGVVEVDFDSDNRTRTPKSSYSWFQGVISRNCLAESDCYTP